MARGGTTTGSRTSSPVKESVLTHRAPLNVIYQSKANSTGKRQFTALSLLELKVSALGARRDGISTRNTNSATHSDTAAVSATLTGQIEECGRGLVLSQ